MSMKIEQPGGHIDQLIRQTRWQHAQLSAMADIKANVLLTISTITLSFCVPYVGTPMLQWPALVMIICCVLTAFASILVLSPKLPPRGAVARKRGAGFNILFFGSFADMEQEEYLREIEAICNEPSRVYETMAKDIYILGRFLAKVKYFYLRLGYQLFIAGLFASGLTFAFVELAINLGIEVWVIQFGLQDYTPLVPPAPVH